MTRSNRVQTTSWALLQHFIPSVWKEIMNSTWFCFAFTRVSSNNEVHLLILCQHLHFTEEVEMNQTSEILQIRKWDWGNCFSGLKANLGSIFSFTKSSSSEKVTLPPCHGVIANVLPALISRYDLFSSQTAWWYSTAHPLLFTAGSSI